MEGKDGYTVMVLPAVGSASAEDADQGDQESRAREGRRFICWEYVGASTL